MVTDPALQSIKDSLAMNPQPLTGSAELFPKGIVVDGDSSSDETGDESSEWEPCDYPEDTDYEMICSQDQKEV